MKLIAITSGKGGTGKSCVTAYTGMALAGRGQRVLLLELGYTFRSLDLITGIQNSVVLDVEDVLARDTDPRQAIVPCERYGNLGLLAAGIDGAPCTREQFTGMIRRLEPLYDYILVDGADIVTLGADLFHTVLIVVTPDSLCIRASAHHSRSLYGSGVKNMRLVINNVPPRVLPMYGAEDFDDVIDMIGAQLIAMIPASPKLQFSSNNAQPLDKESLTVQVFESLAGRIIGEQRPLLIR